MVPHAAGELVLRASHMSNDPALLGGASRLVLSRREVLGTFALLRQRPFQPRWLVHSAPCRL